MIRDTILILEDDEDSRKKLVETSRINIKSWR